MPEKEYKDILENEYDGDIAEASANLSSFEEEDVVTREIAEDEEVQACFAKELEEYYCSDICRTENNGLVFNGRSRTQYAAKKLKELKLTAEKMTLEEYLEGGRWKISRLIQNTGSYISLWEEGICKHSTILYSDC